MSYDIPMGMPVWQSLDRHDGQAHYLHSVAAFPNMALAPYMIPDLKSVSRLALALASAL
jgi:hypothetical protein